MAEEAKPAIGVVGAGLVGLGWAIVFARAGHPVRVFDGTLPEAKWRQTAAECLADLAGFGLIEDAATVLGRIAGVDTLAAAVNGVAYVQESVFERVDVKTALFREIDAAIGPDTAVGSSSSGIPASAFTDGLRNRANYLIAHPVNPPYLVPVVEIVPAPWTSPAAVETVERTMTAVGQVPVRVRREVEGFILNRLQGALLREAWALFEEGYASAADIDKTVSYGLGYRWSFIGPFETIDLNAPGGVRDYAERLGGLYLNIARDRTDPEPWSDELVAAVEAERRAALPAGELALRRRWRDRRLMALAAHKRRLAAGEPS
jgi:3-hydroxyacyl-CoA dehydrogenase